jgi:predicted PurR-regulated permease PerM
MKRIALNTVYVLATLAIAFLFYQFQHAVVLFLISVALAAAVRAPSQRLSRPKIPYSLSLIIVYIGSLGVIIAIIALITPSIISDLGSLINSATKTYQTILVTWPYGSMIQQAIVRQMPPMEDVTRLFSGSGATNTLSTLLGVTASSLSGLSESLIVIILSIYWSMDQVHFERLWLSLLPVRSRRSSRLVWRQIESGIGAYVRSELIQSIIAGLALGIGLALMGVPFPTLLAVLGAIAWLIPYVGPFLVVFLVILVGLLVSPTIAIIAGLYTLLIFAILQLFVEPRLFNQEQYSPLLIIIMVILLVDTFGLIGILIAPPFAAAIQLILRRVIQVQKEKTALPPVQLISDLRRRLGSVQNTVSHQPQEMAAQNVALAERLDKLIDTASHLVEGE